MTDAAAAAEEAAPAGVIATLRGLPTVVRFLLLGVFVNQFGAFLQAFLVLYLVHRGFSTGQAGTALGLYGLGSVAGLLFGGGLTDRLGPRLTIIGAMLSAAALTVAVSLLSSYPAILVVVVAAGAMAQSYRPAAAAMLAKTTPGGRQIMVFAMNRMAINLGALGGPLVAAWLITVSWNLVFWFDGLTSLAYALIAVFLLPRPEAAPASVRAAAAPDSADAADPATQDTETTAKPPAAAGYRTMLRDRRFSAYLFMIFANAVIYIQMMAVLPLSLRRDGHPTIVYSSLFSLSAGMIIAFELLITKSVQTRQPRAAVALGFALLGAGLVGFGLPGGVPVLVAAIVVATLGEMVGGPNVFAWPARVAPPEATGRYLGAAHAMFGLGQAVGPVLGVALWEHIHGAVWWWCGVVAVLCVAAAWLGMRGTPVAQSASNGRPLAAGPVLEGENA